MTEPKGVDKRSKEYREYKQWKEANQNKPVGLGDVIEKIAEKTGVKKVVESLNKDEECVGCKDRKTKANTVKLFNKTVTVIYPEKYNNVHDFIQELNKNNKTRFVVVRVLTQIQHNAWTEFRKSKGALDNNQITLIHEIYSQLFARDFKRLNCCYEQFINDINKVYEEY